MALPGQISVGSKSGVVLINAATGTTAAPTTSANSALSEAKGFKGYTFLANSGPVATIVIWGTLDPAVYPIGGSQAVSWGIIATITLAASPGVTAVTFGGPVLAVTASVQAFTSGTITVWGFSVP